MHCFKGLLSKPSGLPLEPETVFCYQCSDMLLFPINLGEMAFQMQVLGFKTFVLVSSLRLMWGLLGIFAEKKKKKPVLFRVTSKYLASEMLLNEN